MPGMIGAELFSFCQAKARCAQNTSSTRCRQPQRNAPQRRGFLVQCYVSVNQHEKVSS